MRARKWSARLSCLLGTLWVLTVGVSIGQAAVSSVERLRTEAEELWLQGEAEQALQNIRASAHLRPGRRVSVTVNGSCSIAWAGFTSNGINSTRPLSTFSKA